MNKQTLNGRKKKFSTNFDLVFTRIDTRGLDKKIDKKKSILPFLMIVAGAADK